jgi:site-specific DNA recombinase
MNRAAIYARLSRDDGENTSIDTQVRVCREYAEAKGWTVVATFSDADVSGGVHPEKRPDGARLMAARDAGEFDVLIVSEPTRLYRDGSLAAELKRWVFRKVRVVSVSGGIDTNDKHYKMTAGMHGIIGEQFLDMISEKTHQALASRALRKSWTGGKPYGYKLKALTDPSRTDQYGAPARTGSVLVRDDAQAAIVHQMFERFASGDSCNTIATLLNEAKVPSPGSSWDRKVRRCSGWVDSAVRAMLKNPLYTGAVRWNVSKWERNPDTDKKRRLARPKEEWERFTYRDDGLRIVPAGLWESVQARIQSRANGSPAMKSGGKPVYRLSGLLKCDVCGCNYVLDSGTHYGCSGAKSKACANRMRQRRDEIEAHLLPVIQDGLLDPKVVVLMAKEIEREFNRRLAELENRAASRPAELTELDARIARLRARLRAGDPDMAADELQAGIERAEAKRTDLQGDQPAARATAKVLSMLPKAADAYRRQIAAGLDGSPRSAARARAAIRQLVGGEIRLEPDYQAGHLIAKFSLNRVALLRAAGGVGTCGSGGRI